MARTKTFCEAEVLNKAIGLFTAKGFNGTSAQDIVDTLGISRSSLYDTFGDKQGLFLKVLQQYQQQEFDGLTLTLKDAPDLREGLRRLFCKTIQAVTANNCEGGCLMVNAATELGGQDALVASMVSASMQQVEEALYTAIKKAKKSGEINTQYKARELTHFYVNTLTGLRVMARSGATKEAYDDVVKVALSLLG